MGPIFVSRCGAHTSNGRTPGSKAEMLQCRIWRFSPWMLSNQDFRKRSVLQKIWPAVSRVCKIRNSFKSWMHIRYSYNHFNIQFIGTFFKQNLFWNSFRKQLFPLHELMQHVYSCYPFENSCSHKCHIWMAFFLHELM